MIVKVFGDESSDQTTQRVFAVCGVIGTEEEWEETKQAWLSRTNGRAFHAAHCESDYARDRSDPRHQENLDLYKDLTQVLAKSRLDGIGVSLDLDAHRETFGECLQDVGYFKCLAEVLEHVTNWAKNYNDSLSGHSDIERLQLEFTFDHRKQSNGSAGSLYSAFVNQPELEEVSESLLNSKISFDCRANPRIQIADLLAHETMKELDRRITGNPPRIRRSYQALAGTGRFTFIHRGREFCEAWKRNRKSIAQATGMNAQDYVDWLIRRRRVQDGNPHDNWTNRMEYMEWQRARKIN